MEERPSLEANGCSASQEIPRILWNPKDRYCIHKGPPPALCWASSLHSYTPTSSFLKIHFNIILPCTTWSLKRSLSLRFSHQKPVYASAHQHMRYMPRPYHSLDFITWTMLGEEYRSFSSSLCNFLHSLVTPSLLGSNILLNTLFSNTLSLRSSLNVSDQVSDKRHFF